MPLATKNGAIIVKDGKLAEDCGCCGGCYAAFEWVDDPPPSSVPGSSGTHGWSTPYEAGFCACYWKPSVQLTCEFYDYRQLYLGVNNDPLRFGGYLPKGGALHSRNYHYASVIAGDVVDRETKTGSTGSFSGYAASVEPSLNGKGVRLDSYSLSAPILLVAQSTLWIIQPTYQIPVQIGAHNSADGDNVFEGETIANAITGNAGYKYKVTKSTEQQLRAGIDATLARSLKDCDSTYFWNKPWTASIEWDAFSVSSYYFDILPITQVSLGEFSADITASELVQSDNSQPLYYKNPDNTLNDSSQMPLREWVFGGMNGFDILLGSGKSLSVFVAKNAAVAPYEYGGMLDRHNSLGGSACNGCQTRYGVYGYVTRSYLVKRTTPSFMGGSVGWLDTLYFDDVLSPCFDEGSGHTFDVKPNRRTIQGFVWVGGYLYSTSGGGSNYADFANCNVTIET